MKLPNHKLMLIEWTDSYGVGSRWEEWETLQQKRDPLTIHSVGWVSYRDDDVVVLLPNVSIEEHAHAERQACGTITIPVVAIVKEWEVTF